MTKKPFDLHGHIERQLRKVWQWFPPRAEARKRVQVGKDLFTCESCGKQFTRKETHVDHKQPVVAVTGWVDWNTFIDKLFCDVSNLQILCKKCHKEKTNAENRTRRFDWGGMR